jgi:hypothetical protein
MLKLYSRIEPGVLKYLFAAILLAVPLYPKFPFLEVPGTYVAIRLEDFLIGITVLVWGFSILRGKKEFPGGNLGKLIIIFLTAGLISIVSAIFITETVIPHIGVLHLIRRFEYVFAFFLAVTVIKTQKDVLFYFEVIFWTLIIVLLYGLGQKYLEFPVISTQNSEFAKGLLLKLTPGARLNSTFAGHYDLAGYAVLSIPIFMALFALKDKLWTKIMGFTGFVGAVWLLLASSSRISFPAYLISGVVFLVMVKRKIWIAPFIVFSLFLMLTTTELAARYTRTADVYLAQISKFIKLTNNEPTEPPYSLDIEEPITPTPTTASIGKGGVQKPPQQVTSIPTPTRRPKRKVTPGGPTVAPPVIVEERSTAIRLNAEWPRAIRAFKKNPALGTGYSSITLATDNDYLRLLGEVGLIGAIPFMLILAGLVKLGFKMFAQKGRKVDAQDIFVAGLTASIVGVAVNATFIDVFEASKVAIPFWAVAGILYAASKLEKSGDEKSHK